ncbi:polyketide synthase dehydratase domain-containing protein, partial [Sphaerisporangium sp. NPDC049003]|uniref:polyketide synthase dehydratase domain-containing protein n=1 Tax=Sphaerisporangium sp. NPDC049003 TaxID=3364517 RepID=UPI003712C806
MYPDPPVTKRPELPTYPFQHQRYWLTSTVGADVSAAGLGVSDHPLVGAVAELADQGQVVLTGRLSLREHPWLADHAVAGRVLVPGTAFVDLVLRAGDHAGHQVVDELVLQAPLVLDADAAVDLQVIVGAPRDNRCAFSVHSRPYSAGGGVQETWTSHASGHLSPVPGASSAVADWGSWPPPGAHAVEVDGLYERLATCGYQYGPAFQAVNAIWRQGDDLYAEVRLPESLDGRGHGIHPALLDAALHPLLLLTTADTSSDTGTGGGSVRLPFALSGITLHATDATTLRVRVTTIDADTFSLTATDPADGPVITIDALTLRSSDTGTLNSAPAGVSDVSSNLFQLSWAADTRPVPADVAERRLPRCAVLAEQDPERAIEVATAIGGVPVHRDLTALIDEPSSIGTEDPALVVWLPPLTGDLDVPAAVHAVTEQALELLHAWIDDPRLADTRLIVLTHHAVATGPLDGSPDLAQAAVWGLVRTAQNEYPHRFALLDTDHHEASYRQIRHLLTRHIPEDGEDQLLIRQGVVHTSLLTRVQSDDVLRLPDAASWRLDTAGKGTLANLVLTAGPDPVPGATTADIAGPGPEPVLADGHVRLRIRASGLNFRDVVVALDVVGEDGLGLEGAGVVTEVGPGVQGLAVGDRVMGFVPDAFAPAGVTDQRMVIPVPRHWSFTDAASATVAYLTACHALSELAGVQAG